MYWLLDHSEVALIYNDRKNAGLFAEWPRPVVHGDDQTGCSDGNISQQLSLWRDHAPDRASKLLDAVLRDLSSVQSEHHIKVVIAVTGMGLGCADQTNSRKAAVDAIDARVRSAGLGVADLDGLVAARVGEVNVAALHGFGSHLGVGHLNANGNSVYGEVLAQIVREAMAVQ
jgi:hypothetical protein